MPSNEVGDDLACDRSPTTLGSMEVLAGAALERPPGAKYTGSLRYAEIAPSMPLPKPSTLARWRKALPEGFELGLRAPKSCWDSPAGPLRPSSDLDRGLSWLEAATRVLEPSTLVVSTGATVTTGARDRERLKNYFSNLPRFDKTTVVWRAAGLWEPEVLQAAAKSMGVIAGFDGIDDPAPAGDTLYASLTAEGLRRSFSHAQLLEVLDKLLSSQAKRAFVVIDSAQSVREAQLLHTLSEDLQ
ncbi:MAG: DUF72 domain-containing protein [Myxococcota bacterium]